MLPKSLLTFPTFEELSTLNSILDWQRFGASQMERSECFYGHGFGTPWEESRFLVLRALSLDWDVPDMILQSQVTPKEAELLYDYLQKRCVAKIPSAYLLEEAWFFNEPFRVTNSVLIPRSPIGELIDMEFAPWLSESPQRVLDLCTGSGCIGIAMARIFPEALVDISDLSQEALDIAIENISQKDLGYQVAAYQGDLYESLPGEQYDLIVSNPPYVDIEDIGDMPEEFSHEPRMGLVAGDDGLDLVRKILAQAPRFLTANGCLVCEVGNSAKALVEAFPEVEFEWPEFNHGGHGVFIISAAELNKHQKAFENSIR